MGFSFCYCLAYDQQCQFRAKQTTSKLYDFFFNYKQSTVKIGEPLLGVKKLSNLLEQEQNKLKILRFLLL